MKLVDLGEAADKKSEQHSWNDHGHCKKCGCSISGSTRWKTCDEYKKAVKVK